MTVSASNGDSGSYFRTPSRGFKNLSSGRFYVPPVGGGGEPFRLETNEEYQARLVAFDAGIQRVDQSPANPVTHQTGDKP